MTPTNTLQAVSSTYSNEELADSIALIAQDLSGKNTFLKRRNLVAALNKKHQGLNLSDGLEINHLVKMSYDTSSSLIQKSIVTYLKENLGNDSIYDPEAIYPVHDALDFSDSYSIKFKLNYQIIENNTKKVNNDSSIQAVELAVDTTSKLEYKRANFLGIGNADNAKEYAQNVLKGYEEMIIEYDKIKNINLDLIDDFEVLRNQLKEQREDVIQLILDLIGDRAKVQHPELFDFSSIDWTEFEDTWQKLEMHYEKIERNHQEFLNVVDFALESFGSTLSSSSKNSFNTLSKISKKRQLDKNDLIEEGAKIAFNAITNATSGIIKSRNKSKEVIALIKKDCEVIKKEMFEDKQKIVADIFRLGKLYSKLTDFLLPNYFSFINANNSLINSELAPIYNKVIANPEIKERRDQNNELIKQRRFLEQQIIDAGKRISFSDEQIATIKSIQNSMESTYDFCNNVKPKKPWIITNILSLGHSRNVYEEVLILWNKHCKPIVEEYNNLTLRVTEEQENIENIKLHIESYKSKIETLTNDIKLNSDTIKNCFDSMENGACLIKELLTVAKKIINASKRVLDVELDDSITQKAIA